MAWKLALTAASLAALAAAPAARAGVPTVTEAGYAVELEKFRGLAGPKGLSPEVSRIWNDAAQKLLADPEYRERYIAGNLKASFLPHEEFVPFIAKVAEETAALFAATGVAR
jgi:putative tricarboxylic transport membrane protein